MLPVTANVNNFIPIQTPLVNTAIPGSDAARVPYDNVAPSVSNAQVENNASGNNGFVTTSGEAAAPVVELSSTDGAVNYPVGNVPTGSTQSAFFAQLLGQDLSPQVTQAILPQYEKLIAASIVKYKPSNAFKPAAEPAGVFGRLLQQDKVVSVQQTAQVEQSAPVQTPVEVQTPAPQVNVNTEISVVAVPQETAPAPAVKDNTIETTTPTPAPSEPSLPTPPAITAYAQTADRPAQQETQVTELA